MYEYVYVYIYIYMYIYVYISGQFRDLVRRRLGAREGIYTFGLGLGFVANH